jgi:hypothetical protein
VAYKLDRPAPTFDPALGLARAEHFQMAYVTSDIEEAGRLFRDSLGIREFLRLEGPMAEGGYIRADFAWVGTLMYEIIQAEGPGAEIFTGHVPQGEGFRIRHHHLGFLIHDQAQWDGVQAGAARTGFAIPHHNVNPLVEVCFVEVPGLGHYLEYLFATPAGMDFFHSVPRS